MVKQTSVATTMENTKFKDGVNRNARLIVRNISFKATDKDLKELFSPYGTVEEVKLLKKPDGKLVGCGFVHFTQVPMANKALAATNKKPFFGRPITVAWAIPKHKYGEDAQHDDAAQRQRLNSTASEHSISHITDQNEGPHTKVTKEEKQLRLNRKARLIIRNISFKATEDSLKEHFAPYGELIEVNLLKKPDGKLVGCGFVHYKNVPMAKKALLNTNMKPFLGRPISVDWAVAKDKYMQHSVLQQLQMQEDVKQESDSDDGDDTASQGARGDVKEEIHSESDGENDVKSEKSEDSELEESSESSDVDEDFDDHGDDQSEVGSQAGWKRVKLNDAEDGCTVFVSNIPFAVDNERLRAFAARVGAVRYALVCVDPLTEHSKGTGFVKFQNESSAALFLTLPDEQLVLEGQRLRLQPALKRDNLRQRNNKQAKDNRNLYLVKEGVIIAGTKAAVGVSASDMSKRLALERSKTQMLKNLNRFVSRYRLVVANLPPGCDDGRLRGICRAAVGARAVLTEARVMRDLRAPLGSDGRHPSKGFGFVMFTRHEDALTCLRRLNNNPDVFDRNNRPIISFSIEDRTALNARKKRLEKSITNNPLATTNNDENTNGKTKRNRKRKSNAPPDESYVKKGRVEKGNQPKNDKEVGKFVRAPRNDESEYTGLTAKEGALHKMRSHHKLRTQSDVHRQNVKQEKKQSQRAWRLKMAAKERIKQPKQKVNRNKGGKRRRLNRDKYLIT